MKKNLNVFRGSKSHRMKKLLLTMKLTVLAFFVGLMGLSASTYSQSARLSLEMKNVSITDIFERIEAQSEFVFIYKNDAVDPNKRYNIEMNDSSVESILNQVFRGSDTRYEIKDRQIIITKNEEVSLKPKALKLIQPEEEELEQPSGKEITGTVVDADGLALPGVSVIVKGTTIGTITDMDGKFRFSIPLDSETLLFSFVGMKSQELAIGNKNNFSVTMEENVIGMDEVVVTALGLERDKKALGYSVGEVNSEELNKVPQENALNSLFAKVSGLKINNSSNDINSHSYVTIRGLTSLVGNNSPLVVFNGIPNSNEQILKDINSEDIENISVLKGPSAAALYGSRAGNGVILITTKSGKRAEKGIGVSVNIGSTFTVPYKFIDMQNTFTTGKSGVFDESSFQSWYGPQEGEMADQWNTDGEEKLVFYDNQLSDFFQTGITTTADISIDGTFDRGNYRFSASHFGGSGVFPELELQRTGISMAVDYEILPKLKLSTNINISNPHSDNYQEKDGSRIVYTSIYQTPPHVNINDLKDYWVTEDVEQRTVNSNYDNPWFAANELITKFDRTRTLGAVKLEYEIMPDLTLMTRYAYNSSNYVGSYQQPWDSHSGDSGGQNTPEGYYEETHSTDKEVNADFLLSWKKKVGKLDIRPSVGGNIMQRNKRVMFAGGKGLVIPGLYTLSNVQNTALSYSTTSTDKDIYSVYGLASLSYADMVYVDLTARNDWSSTLPEENRSYFYPSVSLSFLVDKMIKLPDAVSLFKIRSGWAQVGKDTDPYEVSTTLNQGTWGSQFTYSVPGSLPNVNLKPEIATSFEIGTDVSFFTNRIGLGFTYYKIENENQILDASTSVWSGNSAATINAGSVQNKGVEVELNAIPVKKRNFRWDMKMNFTRERSKLVELTNDIDSYEFWESTKFSAHTNVGGYIGDMWAYDVKRVEEGEYKGWALLDSNGKLQVASEYSKVGNFTSDFVVGMQTAFTYKNVSLSMSFDWRQGGEYYDQTMMRIGRAGKVENIHPNKNSSTFTGLLSNKTFNGDNSILAQEIKNNPEKYQYQNIWVGGRTTDLGSFAYNGYTDGAFYPGVISDGNGGYIENFGEAGTEYIHAYEVYATSGGYWDRGNKWVYDGSFVKLREISLAYKLPQKLANKLLAQDITISAFMRNILLWSAAKTGMDPESQYHESSSKVRQGLSKWNGSPIVMPAGFKLSLNF